MKWGEDCLSVASFAAPFVSHSTQGIRRSRTSSGAAFGFLGSLRGSKDPESRKRKGHPK